MLAKLLLTMIRLYQLSFGAVLPAVCRFEPSCSRYTAEAIRRYGPWRGSWLGIKRILRCQPFCAGGDDPVPGSDPSP